MPEIHQQHHRSQQVHEVVTPPQGKRDDSYPASEESFEDRVMHDIDIRDIQVELNVQTYKKKFNNLICWEEKSHIEILEKK